MVKLSVIRGRQPRLPYRFDGRRQEGFTIIEMMIAIIVLAVGLLAMAGLLAQAATSNNRNKVDSTATMVAQAVVEQINSTIIGGGTATLTDCEGTAHAIDTGVAVGDGAKVTSDGSKIDFIDTAPPDGYHMDYAVCGTDPDVGNPRKVVYDVRWHLDTIAASGGVTGTYLITVGAVVKGAPAPTRNLRAFAFPTNLRVLVGPESVNE
jgi:prepilin-type N-terminal cleavage/methylation domain-containing protein